ncbi:MAG: homoserine O-succinyltransferase [Albidovulum sp.]|nr:homoserine O-succinyltransferase [Albidovulum sp.]
MPINIPETLPAYQVLQDEGVMVMSTEKASRQDIRPLNIGLLNLMPEKIKTETQFARLIGATPLQINLTLLSMSSHKSKTTSAEHMEAFYEPFAEVRHRKYDGLIVTGAPIEHLPYEDVTYWSELCELFEWAEHSVHSLFGICWGGMAMLYYWYGIEKHMLAEKAFGCYSLNNLAPSSPYLRGFSDECVIPISRWTEVKESEIGPVPELRTLLGSDATGPCLVEDRRRRALAIFNHFEYDSETLNNEYRRDIRKGVPIKKPVNYYPKNDTALPPQNRWRSHGHLLYGNWINEIYQTAPYDPNQIGAGKTL